MYICVQYLPSEQRLFAFTPRQGNWEYKNLLPLLLTPHKDLGGGL